ncbi:thiosulfate sulfurtransferase, Rhodanese-like protein [Conidiobolus coronatus NRRL 28638]|uniref:Thiosulfate sulfurtransferase, Rhodanese-like protein n=1 Tax=Conidiobolus coronatus (strain ATCC 28846 / CBS 209.66 / NRRL 28638) TaxID=796925 RepID=A0A137PAF9_CONC2|nr:thiosulfate sulfurtransferase, Rhodanese-like protein [Conidiobolus coronatus NRRL 28638]|eukprot:KXN71990.1 thiosulfate sulfurtransferase, Rhodanese-like protein [Conidiobolus coronatus NRRL 28638]
MKLPVPPLLSTQYVSKNLQKLVLLDSSWYMPNVPRNPSKEFESLRLPNSRFFNIDEVKDHSSKYPHMLPSPSDFSKHMERLKIQPSDHVVVYDTQGVFSSPRVFWTFKAFNHDNISVLNGGLPKWQTEGLKLIKDEDPSKYFSQLPTTTYPVPELNSKLLKEYSQVLGIVKQDKTNIQILDARPTPRFTGEQPEPRPELSSGHMPHSKSLPFNIFIKEDENGSKVFKSSEEVKSIIKEKGIDLSNPIINTCGSGITASILYFSLKYLPNFAIDSNESNVDVEEIDISVYDGSWTEYASKKDTSIILKN